MSLVYISAYFISHGFLGLVFNLVPEFLKVRVRLAYHYSLLLSECNTYSTMSSMPDILSSA
jgi:hypothetical protein